MSRSISYIPIAATATTAAIAACAAVGVVFLVPNPGWRELSGIVVPVVALLFTSLLLTVGKTLLEQGTENGRTAAQVDEGTGLPSDRVAEHVLSAEFAAAERGRPLTIVLFRIDKFRRFGSMHGPDATARLLVLAGRVFKRRTRGMNLSTRQDQNGTFMSILSGQDVVGARVFASRVQKDLASLEVAGETLKVFAGIATFDPGMTSPMQLVFAAEKALLEAERTGSAMVVTGDVLHGQAIM